MKPKLSEIITLSAEIDRFISQYNIKEIIIPESQFDSYHHIVKKYNFLITKVANWYLDLKIASDYLKEHFKIISLKLISLILIM